MYLMGRMGTVSGRLVLEGFVAWLISCSVCQSSLSSSY